MPDAPCGKNKLACCTEQTFSDMAEGQHSNAHAGRAQKILLTNSPSNSSVQNRIESCLLVTLFTCAFYMRQPLRVGRDGWTATVEISERRSLLAAVLGGRGVDDAQRDQVAQVLVDELLAQVRHVLPVRARAHPLAHLRRVEPAAALTWAHAWECDLENAGKTLRIPGLRGGHACNA